MLSPLLEGGKEGENNTDERKEGRKKRRIKVKTKTPESGKELKGRERRKENEKKMYSEVKIKNARKRIRMTSSGTEAGTITCRVAFPNYLAFTTTGNREEKRTLERKGERDKSGQRKNVCKANRNECNAKCAKERKIKVLKERQSDRRDTLSWPEFCPHGPHVWCRHGHQPSGLCQQLRVAPDQLPYYIGRHVLSTFQHRPGQRLPYSIIHLALAQFPS